MSQSAMRAIRYNQKAFPEYRVYYKKSQSAMRAIRYNHAGLQRPSGFSGSRNPLCVQ